MATRKKARRLTPIQKAKAEAAQATACWNRAEEAFCAEQRAKHEALRECGELRAEIEALRAREKTTAGALDHLRSHIYNFVSALRRDADKDRATSHVSVEMLMMLAQLVPVVSVELAFADQDLSATNAAKAA